MQAERNEWTEREGEREGGGRGVKGWHAVIGGKSARRWVETIIGRWNKNGRIPEIMKRGGGEEGGDAASNKIWIGTHLITIALK